jgi:isocitrate dehydrogenase kinase/phosphatase
MTANSIGDLAAKLVLEAFDAFNRSFGGITSRARQRFEKRDWAAGLRDTGERMDAYENALDDLVVRLDQAFGSLAHQQDVWLSAKGPFASLVATRYDIDRAETFFNSATRKMLHTVGINREVEFFYLHPKAAPPHDVEAVYRRYRRIDDTCSLITQILGELPFGAPFENISRDAGRISQEIDLHLWPIVRSAGDCTIDVVRAIFYRNKEAYAVGRITANAHIMPLIIAFGSEPAGICVNSVLLRESEASIAFSFAYSSFFVDIERYDALLEFLESIIPHTEPAELYASLGYSRHGKTEFYRNLHRFVHVSKEQFVIAPGREGAVMIVFTLPNFGFVFKVIKDQPCFLRSKYDTPKAITQDRVRFQYNFVSHRDRAGRLVDTQEFENLRFRRKRFSGQLLEEFAMAGKRNVTITDDYVILHHLYVQRKVVPLPIYFESERSPEDIRHVLVDFGYFLKDLAASGVFPADLFNTWNYGVTHWGRVLLYDYDDVLPIERITFREKPLPRNDQEETQPEEDWIFATEEDFFMDEIERYSGIPPALRGVFKSVHGDLYTLKFWNTLTERLKNGEVFDVIPYDRSKRFHDRGLGM